MIGIVVRVLEYFGFEVGNVQAFLFSREFTLTIYEQVLRDLESRSSPLQ